ncbi:MAG TPA: tRNA (N6-threonylcarbamoyladenosine(37)-N6)-methyltransferase TrmO [Thermoanaerobaculia bacterium]|nr:tRNA (N6-threonylcarbamoyladenosine(37)-N6)-methyltransferase TrmO [Thermoanaerobaculia bacterium]
MIVLNPIGVVRSPHTEKSQIPKGPGARHEAEGVLEIREDLQAGLDDIEGFSHLYVLWIFDRSEGYELLAQPPTDDRPHGVFATRAPRRPNPIGLTVVQLLGRDGPRLRVRGLDMLDGTPIVDIKPYLSSVPAEDLRRGWLAEAEARAGPRPSGGTVTADESVAVIVRGINDAWRARKYDDIGRYLAEDVVIAPPGSDQRIAGREAYVQSYRDFDAGAVTQAFSAGEPRIDIAGEVAVASTPFEITYEMQGQTYHERGTDLLVLRRDAGEWRVIWRSMHSEPA